MTDTTIDDYLWDHTGEPDDVLRHLESVLLEYRHREAWTPIDDLRREGDRPPDDNAV